MLILKYLNRWKKLHKPESDLCVCKLRLQLIMVLLRIDIWQSFKKRMFDFLNPLLRFSTIGDWIIFLGLRRKPKDLAFYKAQFINITKNCLVLYSSTVIWNLCCLKLFLNLFTFKSLELRVLLGLKVENIKTSKFPVLIKENDFIW